MKLLKTLCASAVLLASAGASAGVVGSLGGGFGSFATLSGPGTFDSGGMLSGSVSATIVGGTVYSADQTFADNVIPGDTFLAAGPSSGTPSTLTLAGTGLDYVSFLWGSPDTYNVLTVNSTGPGPNSQMFTTATLGFTVSNGDQSFNQNVQFQSVAGSMITSLVFASSVDAFETAFFSATPVPEPETYALMLAGLGALGFVSRRRKKG